MITFGRKVDSKKAHLAVKKVGLFLASYLDEKKF
jgi:hypothetical protein